MMRLVIFSVLLTVALGAPTAHPVDPVQKSELKTPASTVKLAPLVSPIAHIPFAAVPLLPQVSPGRSPYAYSYPAPVAPVAYVPGSYSIEQHGYNIAY